MAVNKLYHGLLDESRKCFSDVQAKDANPLIWVSLGNIFEMMPDARGMMNASNAYEAAIEVSKPTAALLSSAVAFLRLNEYIDANDQLIDVNVQYSHVCTLCARISVKHNSEVRLGAYVRRRPVSIRNNLCFTM